MKNLLANLLLAIPFFLAYATVICQPPFHQSSQFGLAAGLTETPERMVQDDEGFLWLGTRHGLFRFDGVQAVKVNYLTNDSLPESSSNIYELSFDPKNQLLWLGTDYGIFRYDLRSGRSEHLQAADFFEEKDISHKGSHILFTDRQGETWADFGVYGLVHLIEKRKRAESFYLPLSEREKAAGLDAKMANTVRTIVQDANNDNILWMGTRRGLLKFDKAAKRLERFIFYTENEEMRTDANAISRLVAHPNGCIYLSSWDAGLLKFDPKTASFSQFYRTALGWTDAGNTNRIGALVLDEAGNLWTDGSGGGSLFDVKNERFTTPPMPDFNVDFRDRDGNFWQFKSGLRLFHRRKNQLQKHPIPDFVACEHLSDLPFDSRRRQIFLRSRCQNGLWALDVDKLSWRQYPLPGRAGEVVGISAYGESPAGFFISDAKERLYMRAAGSDEFRLLPVSFPAGVGNLTLQSRADGDLFITGHEGWLFWLKPPSPAAGRKDWQVKTFSKISNGGTLPDHFYGVSKPTFDQTGRLWLRTNDGFSIFSPEENSFLHVSEKQGGVKHLEAYEFFLPDGQGKMWVSGNGGFGWLDPSKPEAGLQKLYAPGSGFPYPQVGIALLAKEKLWLKTRDGLVEFDPQTEKYRLFDFLKSDNIRHLGEGKLIAFVGKGYHLFQLDSLQLVEEQPKPYVSWFKVFEKRVPISGGLLSPDNIRLKPGENFFSLGFSALAWHDPQQIKFAYKLEGVNEDWVFAEPGVHAASYTNIGGGDYVFKVKTTDSRGEWAEQAFELQIHVGTPWWKTWWFRLLLLASMAGILYLIVKNRFRQQQILLENHRLLLEKEHSLRNERDRIAAEMHDDLGAGLSTIRFLSLLAKEKESDPANAGRIDKIAQTASGIMEKMADIIWVMNSRNDSLANFAAYIRRHAGDYFDTHGIRFSFEMPKPLPNLTLSGEQRRTLLLAVKECLHNVVKHAAATEVHLGLSLNGQLEIIIRDNGNGIPQALLEHFENDGNLLTGNGLHNLRHRMEALGGRLALENNAGTTVRLKTGIG